MYDNLYMQAYDFYGYSVYNCFHVINRKINNTIYTLIFWNALNIHMLFCAHILTNEREIKGKER